MTVSEIYVTLIAFCSSEVYKVVNFSFLPTLLGELFWSGFWCSALWILSFLALCFAIFSTHSISGTTSPMIFQFAFSTEHSTLSKPHNLHVSWVFQGERHTGVWCLNILWQRSVFLANLCLLCLFGEWSLCLPPWVSISPPLDSFLCRGGNLFVIVWYHLDWNTCSIMKGMLKSVDHESIYHKNYLFNMSFMWLLFQKTN